LKASISITEKKNAKNASTGPNKFSKQCHYAPELPAEAEKRGNDSWSKAMYGWLTCAVTTTCSVPPASNYAVSTQKH